MLETKVVRRTAEMSVIPGGGSSIKYTGRVLGVLSGVEFNTLIQKQDVQRKILSGPTVAIKDIGDNFDDIKDLRLAFAIKTKDGETRLETLFVTEPLDMVTSMLFKGTVPHQMVINGTNDTIYQIVEENIEANSNG
jgi:hypothetical protein